MAIQKAEDGGGELRNALGANANGRKPPLGKSGALIFSLLLLLTAGLPELHAADPERLIEGKFGKAIALDGERKLVIPFMRPFMLPVTIKFWIRLEQGDKENILLTADAWIKNRSWMLSTAAGSGNLSLTMPQLPKGTYATEAKIADGKWHYIAFRIGARHVGLYVDGQQVLKEDLPDEIVMEGCPLVIGAASQAAAAQCAGAMDELSIIERQADPLAGEVPSVAPTPGDGVSHIYHFDELTTPQILWPMDAMTLSFYGFDDLPSKDATPDAVCGTMLSDRSVRSAYLYDKQTYPDGSISLDDMQDKAYAASGLYGDMDVERESRLPVLDADAESFDGKMKTVAPEEMSLSGEWLMKDSEHFEQARDNIAHTSKGLEEKWQKPETDRSDWDKVQVPTSVQAALIKLGKLPDPNWGTNTYDELNKYGEPRDAPWNLRLTRIEQKDWWFARSFTVPSSWKGKPLRLYFDGLDYSGSIYLNGQSLGYHAGMFGGPTLDVTKAIKFDAPNWLVVRIDSAPPLWYGLLKGQIAWGMGYGHLISLGIWRDVTLSVIPQAEVSSPYVVTKSIEGKKAVLQVEYEVESQEPGTHKVEMTGSISGANFESKPVKFANTIEVPYGRSRYHTEVTVDDAQLWWPVNYGKQNLYKLDLTASGRSGDEKMALNSITTRFGIRTIEMRKAAGEVPRQFYRWQFVINGEPMFIKGTCWYWPFPEQVIDPAKYERFLELAKRAGVQMFRVGGFGQIENDEFYRLCDEKGLMVYQEFPFCWGPPDFPFTDPVVEDQQVTTVVKRLRNHPSLVMWGGANESVPSAGITHSGNDEALFLLGKRCREYDPSRPFHRTDPWGGSAHNWEVWHSREPFDAGYKFYPSVWYGEYGTVSTDTLSSAKKYLPEQTLQHWPLSADDNALLSHTVDAPDFINFILALVYIHYGPVNSWETFTEYSQMAQGDWLRFAAEGQRSGSGVNKTGFWYYEFDDKFPDYSPSIVNFYGAPKLAYYRAKQTFKPQCAFAFSEKLNWPADEPFKATLHVSNDTSRTLSSAQVTATVYGSDLQPVWNKQYPVKDIAANQRVELETIKVPIDPAKRKPFLLAVTMHDSSGKLLSDQWYWFNYQAQSAAIQPYEYPHDIWKIPKEKYAGMFQAYASLPEAPLLTLPKTTLSVRLAQDGSGGKFIVKNTGNVPAFNVLIDNFPEGWKDFLDDNSFFLRPGEERDVAFELGKGESVDGVSIRAWNAPATKPTD